MALHTLPFLITSASSFRTFHFHLIFFIFTNTPFCVRDSLLLKAVKVNDGLELEVTDPQENQGEVEQEDGES